MLPVREIQQEYDSFNSLLMRFSSAFMVSLCISWRFQFSFNEIRCLLVFHV